MNNRKPTWNYILNDIAFISLLTECLYSEYPSSQHKYDLEYQIKLIQDKLNKQKEVLDKIKEKLHNSKEYKMAIAMELNKEQSILIDIDKLLEEIE